jgi:hypothetical protein
VANAKTSSPRSQRCGFLVALALKAAASAASEAEPAARQQQDEDDDEKDREHGHLPTLDRLGALMSWLPALVLLALYGLGDLVYGFL